MAAPVSTDRSPPRDFATVFARLRPHMAELDVFLRSQIAAFEPEIREMADYCIDTSGKRIRPALVFLSGWQGDGRVLPELVRVAAVVELVHLATLVHDDIMDESELRRGRRTAARAFGPEAAVLLGDALFSHALFLAAQFPTTSVCRLVADSTRRVCAGEIIQTLRRRTDDISDADYRRIVDLKTAELFRASCALGTELAQLPAGYVEAAATYGRQLGIAYQMYDDLADFFGREDRIGKTLGTDLISGKLTLPLLRLRQLLPEDLAQELLEEIRGQRPARLGFWLEQMERRGTFAAVTAAILGELEQGEAVLGPWSGLAPTPLLLQLGEVLREQVAALRPASA